MSGVWHLNIHLDTATRAVRLSATDLDAHTVQFEHLELITVAAVRVATTALITRNGRPGAIMTDHGAIFAGLGDAIGVEQRFPSKPNSQRWIERLTARATA